MPLRHCFDTGRKHASVMKSATRSGDSPRLNWPSRVVNSQYWNLKRPSAFCTAVRNHGRRTGAGHLVV